ncbi:MAG: helix-turn-helix domain-containing protein [Frankiaceae bacterium]
MTEKAGPIGPVLAAARERRGWSLEEVATRTRIRSTLLASMEVDDFSGCGGAVYAKGHIRGYALAVGLDPEPLVAAFEATHDTRPPTMAAGTLLTTPVSRDTRGGSNPRWMPATVGAIAVVLLLVAVASVVGGDGPTTPVSSPQASPSPTPSPKKPSAPAPTSPTPHPNPPAIASGNVALIIRVGDQASWMRVTDQDGRVLIQDTLAAGTVRSVLATRRVTLVIGNSGAVQLACNDHFLGPAGAPAQVATVTLDGFGPECAPG